MTTGDRNHPGSPEETAVSDDIARAGLDRRNLLKGGLGILGAGALGAAVLRPRPAGAAFLPWQQASPPVNNPGAPVRVHLAATDGWVSMPGTTARPPFWPDPMAPTPFDTYVFGFRDVTPLFQPDGTITAADQAKLDALRGKAQISAPIYGFDQDDEIQVSLANLGLTIRPDLTDGHTVHWHGFNNAIPLFDGVPELSIAVPIGRSFTYEYRPRDPGTYMYHCHFEDVEHVQMGMTGILYVRPKQNRNPIAPDLAGTRYAYNDGVPSTHPASTAYHREFSFILTELWPEGHYRDAHIQTTDWTDFAPAFWLMNGRANPDTLQPNGVWDPGAADLAVPPGQERLQYQPNTSLIRANAGEKVLLRIANLGYQHHTMTLDGIPMRVVAKDAGLLRGSDGTDLSYDTNSVEVGPGESRDVIVTVPTPASFGPDGYATYLFYDRSFALLNNDGGPGYGGMLTEVRVYPVGSLGAQPINSPNA
jgi:FtsP/CotA-like multicopper oxidase with cupredoxin domain